METYKIKLGSSPVTEVSQPEVVAAIKRYTDAEARKDEAKCIYDEIDAAAKQLVGVVPVGSYFSANGLVYKVVKPCGTFVSYRDVAVDRTKKDGEQRGSLSLKEAQEAGF